MGIYFDHNATTPLDPRVLEAMLRYLRGPYGNPSSVHRYGRAARDAVEAARAQVAALVGCEAREVVFTSGGTESDNLALKGASDVRPRARVLYGGTEHPAVLEAGEALQALGRQVEVVAVDGDGAVIWDAFTAQLQGSPVAVVSLMTANNETGVIQDVARAAAAAHAAGTVVHTDAVQAAGKIPLDFTQSGADLMSLSAHKINGPKGVGALVVKSGTDLTPQQHGGGHEQGLRSGTLNLPGIVGFGAAAELAQQEMASRAAHVLALRQRLEAGLREFDGAVVFGVALPRLPNTVQFSLGGFDGEALLMALDRKGMAVSSGSACQATKGEPSHVLLAMGVPYDIAKGAIRVSLGQGNTEAEVDQLLVALRDIRETLTGGMAAMASARAI